MNPSRFIKFVLPFLIIVPCYAQEQIKGYTNETLPVLNNELRRVNKKIDNLRTRTLLWSIPGSVYTGTNVSSRIDVAFAGQITKATAYSKTAPTGASMLIDINKNGTSIWATNQGKRLTVAATANTGNQTNFDTTSFTATDYFTIDIDQIGSTIGGADLTVQLQVTENII